MFVNEEQALAGLHYAFSKLEEKEILPRATALSHLGREAVLFICGSIVRKGIGEELPETGIKLDQYLDHENQRKIRKIFGKCHPKLMINIDLVLVVPVVGDPAFLYRVFFEKGDETRG